MARAGAFRPAYPVRPFFRGRVRGWGWGYAYLPYDYYDYYDYPPAMTEAPPWENGAPYPSAVAEAPPWVSAAPEKEIHPILIERQGDQWVQVSGYSEAPVRTAPPASEEAARGRTVTPEAAEPPLPSAVLVFRDGHQEEVKSYTIIGSTLYVRTNYWTSGSWTRKIELSSLDVPATLKLNQERGSKFSLPSGPQEIVIRL